ncbi:MAG: phage tail protein [Actinomycetota bacterium]
MAEPFLSEIRIMSFGFPPKGWALCDGQFLPINQNQALFALLGTTYGGNGQTTFALPDLRARVPLHMGGGHVLGESAGEASHTLSVGELPAHTHTVGASSDNGATPIPANAVLAAANNVYAAAGSLTPLQPASVGNTGASQAHENRPPFLGLSFCIALVGIFPSRN